MNKLIQGAEERLVNLWEFTLLKDPDRTLKEDMIPFLKTELETIVKESFKNTRVEERIWENETGDPLIYGRKDGYEIALLDKHNKENQFLNN